MCGVVQRGSGGTHNFGVFFLKYSSAGPTATHPLLQNVATSESALLRVEAIGHCGHVFGRLPRVYPSV